MCGISGYFGHGGSPQQLAAMIASQQHRGPDAHGSYVDPRGTAGMGHNRLSIIDLSPGGAQPMRSANGRYVIVFNGEIYNYLELRKSLPDYTFHSQSDTEVLLAAYQQWGEACLEKLWGMFAFAIWDTQEQRLFAARDRFGVKPFYYHLASNGTLHIASEIKAIHAAGVPAIANETAWATYLTYGLYDHTAQTFWKEIQSLPPGHTLTWQAGKLRTACWYDIADRVGQDYDTRAEAVVQDEYRDLLDQSVRLRFRADVPVGINISGGLDSSTLLGMVHAVHGSASEVQAFTFTSGDPNYDETPFVKHMLERTQHPWHECRLSAEEVPAWAAQVQSHQDEPFGGLPTLAYAKLFAAARAAGVIVLLDGQGIDEQWAGYDYYSQALQASAKPATQVSTVQGTKDRAVRPECLSPEFRALAEAFTFPSPFPDALRNLQYRDTRFTKIPRALRFNDRISMQASTELREPFLDHRLFELALRQPADRKIRGDVRKWMPRQITKQLLPGEIAEAPKRPLQTPQREWLRGPLRDWTLSCLEDAIQTHGQWLNGPAIRETWQAFERGESDNSFYIWQWISIALATRGSNHTSANKHSQPACL
jgi:asparagine synthase (glutamine-hydrolysing)